MAVSSHTPNISQIHLSDSFSSWYYGIYVITIGVGLIMSFFLAFETRFSRPPTSIDGQLLFTDDFGTTRILSDTEAQAHLAELEGLPPSTDIPRKTYRQLINPWSGTTPNGGRIIIRAYIHMAEAFTSPGLLYALLVATIVLGKFVLSFYNDKSLC
jgi:hypothetical protein